MVSKTAALIRSDRAAYFPSVRGLSGFLLAFVYAPGFPLMLAYRLGSAAYRRGRVGRVVGLTIWRLSIRHSACHFSPLAEVGPALLMPHPTGIVIGEGVVIGARVTIYQNVTIGARGDKPDAYPVIGDDVIIYPGAVLVGGIRIGAGARIGANAFVSVDVPDGATVAGVPAKRLDQKA